MAESFERGDESVFADAAYILEVFAPQQLYAIWDYIKEVAQDLELVEGDCRVVDAIYAAEDVRRRKGTLTTE